MQAHAKNKSDLAKVNSARRARHFESLQARRETSDNEYAYQRSKDRVVRATKRVAAIRAKSDPKSVNLAGLSPTERLVLIAEEIELGLRGLHKRRDPSLASQRIQILALHVMISHRAGLQRLTASMITSLLQDKSGLEQLARLVAQAQNLTELRRHLEKFLARPETRGIWENSSGIGAENSQTQWSSDDVLRSGSIWMDIEAKSRTSPISNDLWLYIMYGLFAVSAVTLIVLTWGAAAPVVAGTATLAELGTAAGAFAVAEAVVEIAVALKTTYEISENLRQYHLTGNAQDADVFGSGWDWLDYLPLATGGARKLGSSMAQRIGQRIGPEVGAFSRRIGEITTGSKIFDSNLHLKNFRRASNIKWLRPKLAPKIATLSGLVYAKQISDQIKNLETIFEGAAIFFGTHPSEYTNSDRKKFFKSLTKALGFLPQGPAVDKAGMTSKVSEHGFDLMEKLDNVW